jgi:hypothetical protein
MHETIHQSRHKTTRISKQISDTATIFLERLFVYLIFYIDQKLITLNQKQLEYCLSKGINN